MSLANNVTLKLAGITNLTEDPEGGTVVKTIGGGIVLQYGWKIVGNKNMLTMKIVLEKLEHGVSFIFQG